MEFTHHRIDMAASEERHRLHASPDTPFQLFDIITRQKGEDWYVPYTPISFTERLDWRITRRENHVYIPLVPYLLTPEPDLALGFMLQLAAAAMGSLDRRIRRLHVATGYPVSDIFNEDDRSRMWQYHVGFGVVLER